MPVSYNPKKTKQNCDQGVLPVNFKTALHFRDVRLGKVMPLGADDIWCLDLPLLRGVLAAGLDFGCSCEEYGGSHCHTHILFCSSEFSSCTDSQSSFFLFVIPLCGAFLRVDAILHFHCADRESLNSARVSSSCLSLNCQAEATDAISICLLCGSQQPFIPSPG